MTKLLTGVKTVVGSNLVAVLLFTTYLLKISWSTKRLFKS